MSLMHRSIVVTVALLLAACGGGGGSDPVSTTPVSPGTYRGNVTLTGSAPGVQPVTQNGPAVLVVSNDQTVTVGSFPGSAPISHRSFSHTVPASVLNGQGLSCPQGTITIDGVFSGTTVNGSLSSDGVRCNGVALTFTGSYSASLQTQVLKGGADADLVELMRRAALRALPAD